MQSADQQLMEATKARLEQISINQKATLVAKLGLAPPEDLQGNTSEERTTRDLHIKHDKALAAFHAESEILRNTLKSLQPLAVDPNPVKHKHTGKIPSGITFPDFDTLAPVSIKKAAKELINDLYSMEVDEKRWSRALMRCSKKHSTWLRLQIEANPDIGWEALVASLIQRLGDRTLLSSARDEFKRLQQRHLELASNFALRVTETAADAGPDYGASHQKYAFLEGLKPEIFNHLTAKHSTFFLDPTDNHDLGWWTTQASESEAILKRHKKPNSRFSTKHQPIVGSSTASTAATTGTPRCEVCLKSGDPKRTSRANTHTSDDCGYQRRNKSDNWPSVKTEKATDSPPARCTDGKHNPLATHPEERCFTLHPHLKSSAKLRTINVADNLQPLSDEVQDAANQAWDNIETERWGDMKEDDDYFDDLHESVFSGQSKVNH